MGKTNTTYRNSKAVQERVYAVLNSTRNDIYLITLKIYFKKGEKLFWQKGGGNVYIL